MPSEPNLQKITVGGLIVADLTWVSSHSDSSFFSQSDELVVAQQNQKTLKPAFTMSEELSTAQHQILQEESPYRICVTQSSSQKQSFISASIKTVLFDPKSNDDGTTKCSFAAVIEEYLGVPLELSPLLPRRTSFPTQTNIIVQGTFSSIKFDHVPGKMKESMMDQHVLKKVDISDDDDVITVFKTENYNEYEWSDEDEEEFKYGGDTNWASIQVFIASTAMKIYLSINE